MLSEKAIEAINNLNELFPDDTVFTYKDTKFSSQILNSLRKQGYIEEVGLCSPTTYRNLHKQPLGTVSEVKQKKVITIEPGIIVGKNTNGPFMITEILDQAETDKLWEEQFNKTAPHDCAYHIQFKCGKMYWTLKTQVWKCMSPNDIGWRTCYHCNKSCDEPCRWDQQQAHPVSVVPIRDADLTPDSIFGDLKLIDFAYNAKRHNYYEFECIKCGTHYFRMPPTNKSDLAACTCAACADVRYLGPRKIKGYLDQYNINYQMEYRFDDCFYKKTLPFDFIIFDNNKQLKTLIEYDGLQHYQYVPFFHGDETGFELQKIRDNIKTNYCKDNNIKLLRIPYTEYDNIEQVLKNNMII